MYGYLIKQQYSGIEKHQQMTKPRPIRIIK